MKKVEFLFLVFDWMAEDAPKKIFLFTWENSYTLNRELKRWKDMFAEKNGADSIFSFNRENWDYSQIKQTIFSWGFFVTNKLVILYGIPLDTDKSNTIKAEEIEKLAEDIMGYSLPCEVLLICVSYKPDKRGRFYKRFDNLDKENPSQKIIKTFAPLRDYELSNFVAQESKDLNLDLKVIEALIHKVWDDQFRLESEIDKLRYRKKYYNGEITSKVVDEVCFGMIEEDIFQLLDLALTDPKSAVKFVQWLQDDGLDRNVVNGSFAWGLRNYLFVLDYADHWITDSKQIASGLKQNPRSMINITKKLSLLEKKRNLIQMLFKSIVDIDYDIKSGIAQPDSYFFTIKKVLLQNY